jgi:hypothetical protein
MVYRVYRGVEWQEEAIRGPESGRIQPVLPVFIAQEVGIRNCLPVAEHSHEHDISGSVSLIVRAICFAGLFLLGFQDALLCETPL